MLIVLSVYKLPYLNVTPRTLASVLFCRRTPKLGAVLRLTVPALAPPSWLLRASRMEGTGQQKRHLLGHIADNLQFGSPIDMGQNLLHTAEFAIGDEVLHTVCTLKYR